MQYLQPPDSGVHCSWLDGADCVQDSIVELKERYEACQLQGIMDAFWNCSQDYLTPVVTMARLLCADQNP